MGAPTPKFGLFCKFFAETCMKMKEFGPRRGAHVPGAPPWIRQCVIPFVPQTQSRGIAHSPCSNFRNFFLKTTISVISVTILVWVYENFFMWENIF